MLLHRLILLVMFIVHSISEPTTHCDDMACFAPGSCLETTQDPTQFFVIASGQSVTKSCEAIVKIRPYTLEHMLIVLESYNNDVKSITLEQDSTSKFECNNDGSKITAKYNDAYKELISMNASPLLCEFYVKLNTHIFPSANTPTKLSTNVNPAGVTLFHFTFVGRATEITCDPDTVIDEKSGVSGDDWIKKIDKKFAKLECPSQFQLMYREGTAEYQKASEIKCEKKGTSYKYFPKLDSDSTQANPIAGAFDVKCYAKICTMCGEFKVPTGLTSLKREERGGCTSYKCEGEKAKIKVDDRKPIEGVVECKLYNDKPVWQLGVEPINENAKIQCITKIPCEPADAKRLCNTHTGDGEKCIADLFGIPKCTNPKHTLKWGDQEATVVCNDEGKYQVVIAGTRGGTFDAFTDKAMPTMPIKCVGNSTATPAASTSSFDPKTIAYAVGGIVAIAAVVGGIFLCLYCMKKKRRGGGGTGQMDLKTARENKESKSKEAKSANSSKNQAESKKEEGKKVYIPLPMHQTGNEMLSESAEMRKEGMNTDEIAAFKHRVEDAHVEADLGDFFKDDIVNGVIVKKAEESVRRKDKKEKKDKKKETEKNEKEEKSKGSERVIDPIKEEPKRSDKKEDKKNKKDDKDKKGEKKKEKSGSDRVQKTQASQVDQPSGTDFVVGDGGTTMAGGAFV